MKPPSKESSPGPRRPYQTPQLRRISLLPDEAVLASCKNNSTRGPWGIFARCVGPVALCSHNGS